MPATGACTSTTSTRSRTSWPTRRASWASIRSRGWWTTSSRRRSDHALRLLAPGVRRLAPQRSEEHTSELQSRLHLVCRLLLEKKKIILVLYHNPAVDHVRFPVGVQGHCVFRFDDIFLLCRVLIDCFG